MYFFFSYSRQNNDKYLCDFFEELNGAVKEMVGVTTDVGFFDQDSLEPGEFWEKKIEQALTRCRIFIAAITAGYFKSEYCCKEWAAFQWRLECYAKKHGCELPPLILPLIWHPPAEPIPGVIGKRQYNFGDPSALQNVKGLKFICKLKQLYMEEHTNYIDALARKILDLHKQHPNLDNINLIPKLTDLPPTWDKKADSMPNPPRGPRRVHFVFGAAGPTEVAKVGKTVVEPYGNTGGEEWLPYYPSSSRNIGLIATQTAANDQLNLWPDELEISDALPEQIRSLESQGQMVVMFVDAWTAKTSPYDSWLQNFDKENYFNCSVIVPWNDDDPDTKKTTRELQDVLNAVLHFRAGNKNDLYYRAPVVTEVELRAQLVEILTRLRAEIINKSIPGPGAVPPGAARPVITGPVR